MRRQRRGGHARGPDDGPRRDALGRPVGALHRDAVVVDVDHRLARARRDAEVLAASAAPWPRGDGGKVVSTRSGASTSRMRAVRGSNVRKSPRSVVGRSRRSAPPSRRRSGPRRRRRRSAAPPGARGRAPARPPRRRSRIRRRMASAPSSDFSSARVLAATRRGRSRSTASRRRRSACRTRAPRAPAPAATSRSRRGARRGRSRVTSASTTRTLRAAAEDAPQRVADLGRRERAGGHLVGERLEEVEVAPVDQRDLDRQRGRASARPAGRRSRRR